jgi:N utilization substance protein B
MSTRRRAREIVLQVLYEEELHPLRDPADAQAFLERRLLHHAPSVEFASKLWRGVLEHRAELDLRIGKHSANWSLKRMATIDRNVLRIAAYEMLYGAVPGPVAINEAIEIARRYGNLNSAPFVNGILDRVWKECSGTATRKESSSPSPLATESESLSGESGRPENSEGICPTAAP